jgi:putative zinc finger/helix-turn-helix YgiT family protein
MICTNCFKEKYVTTRIAKEISINDRPVVIDIECEKCPACNEIVFTHKQSLEFDKKRISLEFGSKQTLTPNQLSLLRKVLNVSLEEISDLLHIGKNTYGRWERGEVGITPSMNLLVHNLIEKIPEAKVNLFETDMKNAVVKARDRHLNQAISLGEYIWQVVNVSKIIPEVVCKKIDIPWDEFNKIQNNELHPEKIPIEKSANLMIFFDLSVNNMKSLFENALRIYFLRDKVTFMHTRKSWHDGKDTKYHYHSISKILEEYVSRKGQVSKVKLNDEYINRLDEYVNRTTVWR